MRNFRQQIAKEKKQFWRRLQKLWEYERYEFNEGADEAENKEIRKKNHRVMKKIAKNKKKYENMSEEQIEAEKERIIRKLDAKIV